MRDEAQTFNILSAMANLQSAQEYQELNWEGSLEDYLKLIQENPRVTRNAFQRIYDMILEHGVEEGHLFPVTCGIATKNLATNRLLDAIVEDLPSPAQTGSLDAGDKHLDPSEDGQTVAYVFKTLADPFAGRINYFRVFQGVVSTDNQLVNTRTHQKEQMAIAVTAAALLRMRFLSVLIVVVGRRKSLDSRRPGR